MSQKRDPTFDEQTDSTADDAPRKRKHSGIGERGRGIKVADGESFDPYRFQTFEVTPAFRQRILEAPLPLLELRDRLLEQAPPSQTRHRAGPDDVTQPELLRDAADANARRPISDRFELELPIPLTRPVRHGKQRSPWAVRIGLFAGAMTLTFLGLAYTQLHTTEPASTNDTRDTAQARNPVAWAAPPAPKLDPPASDPSSAGQTALSAPKAAPAAASNTPSTADNRSNAKKPSSKKAAAKKKLWLPSE